jgi:NADPH:quinone reductase-like Zn-dependent oxidoreductase
MKAAQFSRFGDPAEVIEVVDLPDPGDPGAGEAVIDVELCPINPADLLNLSGDYGAARPKLPQIPGAEGVGRVSAVGRGVEHVAVGDLVLVPGPGTWRQRVKAPAKAVFSLPAGIDRAQLAMLRVNPATAYLMLHDFVAPAPGNWVIQNAANSGVGHCLIRLAREAGVRTVNVVRRAELIEPLQAFGADVVLLDGDDLDARVREAIGDGALPLAIDAVGGTATQRLARSVDDGGTVVNYGLLSGEACRIDARETVFRDVTLRGFWLRRWYLETPPADIVALYHKLAERIADGTLHVDVEATYPLAEIRQAVAHAGRGGRSGKVLIDMGSAR